MSKNKTLSKKKIKGRKIIVIAVAAIMILTVGLLGGCEMEYVRHPKSDTRIDAQLENRIRQDFLLDWLYGDRYGLGTTIDEIFIYKYLGTYNNFVVIEIIVQGWTNSPTGSIQFTVEGFDFFTSAFFTVWYDGNFFTLQNSFNLGHLTLQNIETIYKIHSGI